MTLSEELLGQSEALQDVHLAQRAVITAAPLEVKGLIRQRNIAIDRARNRGCSYRTIATAAMLSAGTVSKILRG